MKKLICIILSGVILLSGVVFTSSYNQTQGDLRQIEKDIEVEKTIEIQSEYKEAKQVISFYK